MSELIAPKRMIELEIDGQSVRVFEGETILGACRRLGIDTPAVMSSPSRLPSSSTVSKRTRRAS